MRQPALVQEGGYRSRAQGRKESESWETMKEEASIGKGQGTGWGSPGHFSPREALGGGAWALPGWIFWLNLELAGEFWGVVTTFLRTWEPPGDRKRGRLGELV